MSKEYYSGHEISESLRSLRIEEGVPVELPADQELFKLLEDSGGDLIHFYKTRLKEAGSERYGLELQSYLSPERQLEIVKKSVGDIPEIVKMIHRILDEILPV